MGEYGLETEDLLYPDLLRQTAGISQGTFEVFGGVYYLLYLNFVQMFDQIFGPIFDATIDQILNQGFLEGRDPEIQCTVLSALKNTEQRKNMNL